MKTMKSTLGKKFTPQAGAAWTMVYDILCDEMVKASNYDKLVINSWRKLKEIEDYQAKAGTALFTILFAKEPETKKVFGFPVEVSPETLVNSRRFSMHASYFVEMLDRALQMVETKQLEDNMTRLGLLHADYGVKPSYFPVMGEALFEVLENMLDKQWTANTKEAWTIVFGRLSSQMIEAMKSIKLEAPINTLTAGSAVGLQAYLLRTGVGAILTGAACMDFKFDESMEGDELLQKAAREMRMEIYFKRVSDKMATWKVEGERATYFRARAADIVQFSELVDARPHVHNFDKPTFWGLWNAAKVSQNADKIAKFLSTANEEFVFKHN